MDKYEHVKGWRKRTKLRAVKAFNNQCGICGYHRCINALEFHHLDPSKKSFTIGSSNVTSWKKIAIELRKCVCLCSVCHTEVECGFTLIPKKIVRFNEEFFEYKKEKEIEYDLCPECNKKKKKSNKYCSHKCAGLSKRKVNWDSFNIKKMIKEEKSIKEIAEIIGVSDNSVRKRMVFLRLPISRYERRFKRRSKKGYQTMEISKKSGFKGVCSSGFKIKKWRAGLCVPGGRKVFVGNFFDKKDAAIAYDKKAIELIGVYAITNKSLGLL